MPEKRIEAITSADRVCFFIAQQHFRSLKKSVLDINSFQSATKYHQRRTCKQPLLKIFKMRHFTLNLVANVIGAILFLVMGVALIVGFAFNYSIEEELQQVMMSNILL